MLVDFGLFVRAIVRDWVALLSGIASVILSALGASGTQIVPSWAFWAAAGACFLFAAFRVWLAEHRTLLEMQENVPPRIVVHGIPRVFRDGPRDFFIVPDVTITNPAHRKGLSLGSQLWATISGGGEAHCPPETSSLASWEAQRQQSANEILVFPLNLGPRQTARGYIAFRGEILRGIAHDLAIDPENGLRYHATRIEFTDYLADPPERVIYAEEVRYYV